MKFIVFVVFILSFFFQTSFSEAQNQDSIFVHFCGWGEDIFEEAKTWKWKINDTELNLIPKKFKIPIHKEDFDTIIFNKPNYKERIILTKFNAGHIYNIHYNYCCNDFDMTEKNDYYDSLAKIEDVMMSYYIHLKEPRVRFKLLNSKPNDTLVGTFGRFAIHAGGIILKKNKVTNYISPFTTGYSTYAYEIAIVRASKQDEAEEIEDDKIYLLMRNSTQDYKIEKFFASIEYRFFGKEKLLVTYDYQTNKMKVEIEN